jgi:hypothetical protein
MTNSKGPETIYSTGQISYWKDGRNMPDVMSGVMQYPDSPEHPAFQLTLQVNFISGTGGEELIQLVGSEGIIIVKGNDLIIKHSIMPEAPGFGGYDSLFTFSKSMQAQMQKEDLSIKAFAFDASGLPAQGKVDYLGEANITGYHVDMDFQKATLPGDPKPFVVPWHVTVTVITEKGKLLMSGEFALKK